MDTRHIRVFTTQRGLVTDRVSAPWGGGRREGVRDGSGDKGGEEERGRERAVLPAHTAHMRWVVAGRGWLTFPPCSENFIAL